MRYAQIREVDIANGPGIRVSLYTQGCRRHCKNCFNQETWDFKGGREYHHKDVILHLLGSKYVTGLTILGGEPLESENIPELYELVKGVRETFGDSKTIWLYSSFLYEDIMNMCPHLLEYIDVLVDGEFIDGLKDHKLRFRGSSNQRIIDVKESKKQGKVILVEKYMNPAD